MNGEEEKLVCIYAGADNVFFLYLLACLWKNLYVNNFFCILFVYEQKKGKKSQNAPHFLFHLRSHMHNLSLEQKLRVDASLRVCIFLFVLSRRADEIFLNNKYSSLYTTHTHLHSTGVYHAPLSNKRNGEENRKNI